MLYMPSLATDASASAPVTGRFLARNEYPAYRKAFLAADLVAGKKRLVGPTPKQAAELSRVSVPYTYAALKILQQHPEHRELHENGLWPLIETKPGNSESLAAHFARSTGEEWLECARTIGPAVVWDRMIAPLI
jgi:hypothetical protein